MVNTICTQNRTISIILYDMMHLYITVKCIHIYIYMKTKERNESKNNQPILLIYLNVYFNLHLIASLLSL